MAAINVQSVAQNVKIFSFVLNATIPLRYMMRCMDAFVCLAIFNEILWDFDVILSNLVLIKMNIVFLVIYMLRYRIIAQYVTHAIVKIVKEYVYIRGMGVIQFVKNYATLVTMLS